MQYSDPAGMPEDERMAGIELKAVREWLAVSPEWLADYLGVVLRTVRRWESGATPIPDGVRLEIEALEAVTRQIINSAIEQLNDDRDPGMVTYRTDEDLKTAQPDAVARIRADSTPLHWPASWHRRLTMRIAQHVPGLVIEEYSQDRADAARGEPHLTPEEVAAVQFESVPHGYPVAKVDDFLDRVVLALAEPNHTPRMTAADVKNAAFGTQRRGDGYEVEEVDAFLDRVIAEFERRERRTP